MSCSHVITTCSSIKYDYWSLISDVYKVETILKVYIEAFQPISNEGYWPQYEGVKVCHSPLMRIVKKGRPKTKRIRTEMDTTGRVPRKCGLCRGFKRTANMDVESATCMTPSAVVISDDLIPEVLSFLSVKSLIRLGCVSKSWRALISDPVFVKLHLKKSATRKLLFTLMMRHPLSELVDTHQTDCDVYCVLYPKSRLLRNPSFKLSVDSYYLWNDNDCSDIAAYQDYWLRIWNPATRTLSPRIGYFRDSAKAHFDLYYDRKDFNFKFGYDNSTDTYKVVVSHILLPSVVKILTLGDNVWRYIENFPAVPLETTNKSGGEYFSGTLNWLVIDNTNNFSYRVLKDVATIEQFRILSLDLGTETYNKYMLPHVLDEMPPDMPSLTVLGDCLCFSYYPNKIDLVIWKMQIFGVEESWVQFLRINYQNLQFSNVLHPNFYVVPLFLFEDTLIFMSHQYQPIFYNWRNNTVAYNRTTDYVRFEVAKDYVESLVSIF
uniref:F-box/kelch-repeat protein At3g23880-like n=1 Tax=Cicer arietinum TaxID=3827 RepID=A0A3Q7YGD3_CICAR|nr:F-box/kelch-repeat protein At3g23880-like [Cicer arietinum]